VVNRQFRNKSKLPLGDIYSTFPTSMKDDSMRCYEADLTRLLSRFASRPPKVVIPEMKALHRRSPGAHFHAFPEFFLQTGGASDFVCPSGKFRLKQGDICIMPAGVAHAESPVDLRSRYGILVLMQNIDHVTLLRGMSDAKRNISSTQVTRLPLPTRAFDCLNTACESNAIRRSLRGAFINCCVQSFLASVLTALRQPAPMASSLRVFSTPPLRWKPKPSASGPATVDQRWPMPLFAKRCSMTPCVAPISPQRRTSKSATSTMSTRLPIRSNPPATCLRPPSIRTSRPCGSRQSAHRAMNA
jgi:hypothetical protein